MSELLTEALARALCVAEGGSPDELVTVSGPAGSLQLPAWVACRPRVLLMVADLRAQVGASGVGFLESALALVKSVEVARKRL